MSSTDTSIAYAAIIDGFYTNADGGTVGSHHFRGGSDSDTSSIVSDRNEVEQYALRLAQDLDGHEAPADAVRFSYAVSATPVTEKGDFERQDIMIARGSIALPETIRLARVDA